MKFSYYKDTDSMYIALSDRESADAREVAPNVVLDFDKEGNIVGIDIYQYASKIIDLGKLEIAPPFVSATA
ncbi:MAG TPA: DUF2283 domain-containing protein [Candidatus Kapabacteria bacterium]|nr:DUF2283 domain-containing protein [Candidatus Kapabacteria bacterium]